MSVALIMSFLAYHVGMLIFYNFFVGVDNTCNKWYYFNNKISYNFVIENNKTT